jgi:hypothetical protein
MTAVKGDSLGIKRATLEKRSSLHVWNEVITQDIVQSTTGNEILSYRPPVGARTQFMVLIP